MTNPALVKSNLFVNEQISHGFFGRAGGHSTGTYKSLNCGPGSGDDPAAVTANRDLCRTALAGASLSTAYQIHSNQAVYTSAAFTKPPRADAIVTDQPGLLIGILTADCIPVLLYDADAAIIGAAHAGWRGALAGVLENCIALMGDHGASPAATKACIGPCLRQNNFEVGEDLVDAFLSQYQHAEVFFKQGRQPEKRQFDLVGFATWRLQEAGLPKNNIDDVNKCTLGAPDAYFSYRFARQNNLPDYGRNLSAICLKQPIHA